MIEKIDFIFGKISDPKELEMAKAELANANSSPLWSFLKNAIIENIKILEEDILDHPDMDIEDNRVKKLYRQALITLKTLPEDFLASLTVDNQEDEPENDDPYYSKDDLMQNKK